MNVSFKAKLPVAQCQLYDKDKKQYVPATLYEFDCQDTSDIKHFRHNLKRWVYMDSFIAGMKAKYKFNCGSMSGLNPLGKNAVDENRFYSLELPNEEIIGICETTGSKNIKNIHYLETQREHRYKYAGQSILATLSKQMLGSSSEEPQMTVEKPANSARAFYINKCGFKLKDGIALYMEKQNMSDFVKSFEKKTEQPIINLYG